MKIQIYFRDTLLINNITRLYRLSLSIVLSCIAISVFLPFNQFICKCTVFFGTCVVVLVPFQTFLLCININIWIRAHSHTRVHKATRYTIAVNYSLFRKLAECHLNIWACVLKRSLLSLLAAVTGLPFVARR